MELAARLIQLLSKKERNKGKKKEKKEKETMLSRKDKNIKENLNLVIFIDLKSKHITIHEYIK